MASGRSSTLLRHSPDHDARASDPSGGGARRRARVWAAWPRGLLATMAALAMVWGAGPAGAWAATPATVPPAVPARPQAGSGAVGGVAAATPSEAALAEHLYPRVLPSVVLIEALLPPTHSSGGAQEEDQGTGFVIAGDYIVTADHVVRGASRIFVTFNQGPTLPAKVAGSDPSDDLAVLKVKLPSNLHPTPLALGNSAAAMPGEPVVIVGNPLGYVDSVSSGVVSGVGGDSRDLSGEDGHLIHGIIQTDAMVDPGSSGSPLFDAAGHVIGIVDATGGQGIGLAIPISTLVRVLPQLKAGVAIVYPWIGVDVATIDAITSIVEGLPVTSGVLVTGVTSGGPADLAGIQPATFDSTGTYKSGSILVSVNGKSLTSVAQLSRAVDSSGIGVPLNLGLWSKGVTSTTTVWPAPWPHTAP